MAILMEEAVEMSSRTFNKELDANAIQMLKDILQKSQYSTPQKSAVREIASNAVDAVNEKAVALSILSGKSKVEDHYMQRDEGMFKDSVFDPTYYDTKWISQENRVEIMYLNNGSIKHDELVIRDHGVGLWGKRLEGYFNLGYSTKRNAKFALGKFGIGAKSALSTGVPYFTMVTRYNGKKSEFNIYSGKIEPVTPAFDMKREVANPSFMMGTGDNAIEVFYTETTEKNGVEVRLQVKKHHKTQYIDAVKSQLMYFSEIDFKEYVDGNWIKIPTKASILYEDDVMVISDNDFHNKPHLLIDRVNYGNIDFTELELEERRGNIGFKVKAEDVTVNPSRESVIWDDFTKESILESFNKVVAAASVRVQSELKQKDLVKWLKACVSIGSFYGGDDVVLKVMAGLVDLNRVTPEFEGYPGLTLSFPFTSVGRFQTVTAKKITKGSSQAYKLERESNVYRSELFGARPVIRRGGDVASDSRKNKYIASVLYPQGFIDVWFNPNRDISMMLYNDMMRSLPGRHTEKDLTGTMRDRLDKMYTFVQETFMGTPDFIDYEQIVVPADFKASEKEEEEEIIVQKEISTVSNEERRALTQSLVMFSPRYADGNGAWRTVQLIGDDGTPYGETFKSDYIQTKVEVVASDINRWSEKEIYYSTQEDEELMHMVAKITHNMITRPSHNDKPLMEEMKRMYGAANPYINWNHLWWLGSPELKLVTVSKDNERYMRDFKNIRQFFMDIDKTTLTMSALLIEWNTGRLINKRMDQLEFLKNFSLNEDLQKAYQYLARFDDRYRPLNSGRYGSRDESISDLDNYLDRVGEFQLFVRDNADDKEAIAAAAVAFLNPAHGVEITNASAIDTKAYDLYIQLLDYTNSVQVMLNNCQPLLNGQIYPELEEEIRNYIISKGADVLLQFKFEQ